MHYSNFVWILSFFFVILSLFSLTQPFSSKFFYIHSMMEKYIIHIDKQIISKNLINNLGHISSFSETYTFGNAWEKYKLLLSLRVLLSLNWFRRAVGSTDKRIVDSKWRPLSAATVMIIALDLPVILLSFSVFTLYDTGGPLEIDGYRVRVCRVGKTWTS